MARGEIKPRESVNKEIKTGGVEIIVSDLRVLSKAETPPFEVANSDNVKDELKLKYRYLDLRNPHLQQNLITRHKIAKVARDYFYENNFLEIETPVITSYSIHYTKLYEFPGLLWSASFSASA